MVGDAVQPVTNGLSGQKRRSLADQDEERGLEGVLGIVRIVEDTTADRQHHGAVTAHQSRESGLVALSQKTLQQLTIRRIRVVLQQHNFA